MLGQTWWRSRTRTLLSPEERELLLYARVTTGTASLDYHPNPCKPMIGGSVVDFFLSSGGILKDCTGMCEKFF